VSARRAFARVCSCKRWNRTACANSDAHQIATCRVSGRNVLALTCGHCHARDPRKTAQEFSLETVTFFEALILIASPVAGLRPMRAARFGSCGQRRPGGPLNLWVPLDRQARRLSFRWAIMVPCPESAQTHAAEHHSRSGLCALEPGTCRAATRARLRRFLIIGAGAAGIAAGRRRRDRRRPGLWMAKSLWKNIGLSMRH
jgi:hypothetical protein